MFPRAEAVAFWGYDLSSTPPGGPSSQKSQGNKRSTELEGTQTSEGADDGLRRTGTYGRLG